MKRFVNLIRKLAMPVTASALALLIAGSTAQTPPVMPTVDLSVGPVAINAQAVNIALALSVEFPTVGAAYRTANYDHAITYLGYFDPTGCYTYKDLTTGAPLSGEYFYRTGAVDASGYCETVSSGGGRYSGNALNYITTSSIDLLRYALTGGNRVVDAAGVTVLERAYLYSAWNLHNGTYFPAKRIPAALVGRVIAPLAPTGDVYAGGCWNRVWFGTSNASMPCDAPGASGNLNPTVVTGTVTGTVTNVVVVPHGDPAPTGGVFQSTTWVVTNPLQTVTAMPTAGPVDFTDVPVAGTGTTTSVPPAPLTPADAFLYNNYQLQTGTWTATAPTPPEPTVTTTTVAPLNPRMYQSFVPATGAYQSLTLSARSGNTTSVRVCAVNNNTKAPGNFLGLLTSAGAPTDVPDSCNSGVYSGYPNRIRIDGSLLPRTVYEPLASVTRYGVHTVTPVYRAYTVRRDYHVYTEMDQYLVTTLGSTAVSGTTTGVMSARVRVCDDVEKTTRTDLCARYPDGNYKPVGEIQRYATGVRVAAFGYLKDNAITAYGGVLRAPMKYMGPTYIDPNGQPQTNAGAEWNADTGVFNVNPLGAASPYTTSGVINYLNKFGTLGSTVGYYKTYDPVGELYYEVLRYYQGLQPSAQAISGYTADTTKADGYPVYTTWTDPVQNACERRNFILTIGDVNTHADKQLPGHQTPSSNGVANTANGDAARATELVPGSSPASYLDSVYWTDLLTGFETNVAKSYTDSLGRAQSTSGNPNSNGFNTSLATKCTGATCSAYYWAGAAYWANTQPIRRDSKGSPAQSMKDVRVKTFTIDVDEGGNGDIEDTNPRGIKPRRSSFYLAGKYGWFNDANLDGNPFSTSGGVFNNKEWEDSTAPNTPDGYVIASQAQKMITGIRKFFRAASSERGAASVSAISTSRFTSNAPDGDFFAPRFLAGDWSGTVQRSRLVLNTTTGIVESTPDVVWDAGDILTSASVTLSPTVSAPFVKPADRKIFTFATDGSSTVGVPFKVTSKAAFDSAVLTALGTNPSTGVADSLTDARINWLRGERDNELSNSSGSLRRRGSIMGDVINSGPVYKQAADTRLQGPGYLSFAQSVSNRTAMLYVGANDGMLHAFRASDGKELFAYIPRAVAPHLNKLTHPAYVHRPYVDGVPLVSEAQVGSSWKTLLVSGMGGGAQGIFALDVTNPDTFGAGNVMFEFTDADDPDMGNVLTQPALVKIMVPSTTTGGAPSYKWFVAVGSGYNNYKADGAVNATGAQAMFFLSVDKPSNEAWHSGTNYFKVVFPVASASTANGMMNPGFVPGPQGEVMVLYVGDLQGNLWKMDLSAGINATNIASSVFTSGGVRVPMFVATSSGTRQPITTAPQAVVANTKGYMVLFGTGKFVEPLDTSTAGQQTIYGIWDSLEDTVTNYTVPLNKLYHRTATLTGTSVTIGTGTFDYGLTGTGYYRGWYLDLPETRERIAVESEVGIGVIAFSAAIPEGTCSGDGNGRHYTLNPVYGYSLSGAAAASPGIPSGPKIFQIELDPSSYTTRSPTGRRSVSIEQQVISSSTKITDSDNALVKGTKLNTVTIPAGRMSWRELRN